jgi:hypothetical protein
MNACRTIKDSQKRLACFDAGGKVPEPPKPDQPTPVSSPEARRTFAANLRRLFLARDWSPYAGCLQRPTTALMRRGSTAKPPSPGSLAPISGKDIRTVAKVGRDERL